MHWSEKLLFVTALVIILAGCFLVDGQSKVIRELRKRDNKKDFKIIELSLDNTEMKRIISLKTVTLGDNEYFMPVDNPVITSGIGLRDSPLDGKERMHFGTDMYSNSTMNVYAVRDGIVVNHWLPPNKTTGHRGHSLYGGYIEILDENGLSTYGHLSETFVREDQMVKAGEVIGIIGNTGLSVGKHLHFTYMLDIFIGGI
jgi:murein DD-endopeptidase MepM/ murein hydrolase activator NlpD